MTSTKVASLANISDTTSETARTEFIIRQMLNRMATATLVLVKAVNTDDLTVNVQPMVAQIDGAGTIMEHGTIFGVPVFTPRGGGSAVLLTPAVGDIGLAVFCHNDTTSVRASRAPAPPSTRRRFDWADALYFGGFLGGEPTQYIKLDNNGIELRSSTAINVYGPATFHDPASFPAGLSADTDVTIDGKAFATHKHGGVQTGSGESGPPE